MRVCKHGSGVKVFCFLRANHASTNLKKFLSSKLDKFTLFTHFLCWFKPIMLPPADFRLAKNVAEIITSKQKVLPSLLP